MSGKTSNESKMKYNKKAYDRIILNVKKGNRDIIKARATSLNKSVNAYITELIIKDMENSNEE